ncbi:DUF3122 domain-containing protein [Trichocoleus sp. FACHB-832]|uniref:DUF3122 domain-containing protein n=1 Tax=Trichocoleus sp. FACHB-832 TaxID=2692875 RepID=UPI0016861360|nr:DUF3122 domain-containing protein [Trichocoleus sp. FACHB-832]MBD1908486.1 DUF3122 domain-containing protein [Trichocoleus sp. FACHB-832]
MVLVWRIFIGVGLCIYLILGNSAPAFASIHTYPESPTQVMYRSRQSLRDVKDQAWQVVLFKRLQMGEVDCVHLRLVGFPGIAELAHPKPLRITAETGEVWTAADVLNESLLPPNVGEYDLLKVMSDLDSNTPLRLNLPLKGGLSVDLLVPPFGVREWRLLMDTEVE